MKQKLYITGLVNLFIILAGTAFKLNHLPGAGILLTIGIASFVMIFMPLALINSYRNSENSSSLLYIITGITCFVVFTAMLFKIMHWPFAGVALTLALPFPFIVFLPVFIAVTSRDGKFSIYNTVFVLLLLAFNSVFSALLSLNVSKQTITESFNVSYSINSLKGSLLNIPSKNSQHNIVVKIDRVLLIIDEYQDDILASEGLSEEKWNKDPNLLLRPDARNVVRTAISQKNEMSDGTKLRKALSELVEAAKSTPGYEDLGKAVPYFAELPHPESQNNFSHVYFTEDFLTWALVYLDSLETNLRLLKATII